MTRPGTSRRRGERAGWRAAGIAAVVLAAACHAAPAGGAAGDPPHGDGSAASSAGDTGAPTVAAGGKLTQAQIAASDNADGERLMRDGKYADAAKKFELAAARWADARYYVNLCTALMHTDRLEDALHACQGARNNEPTPAQRSQVEQLIKDIIQAGKAKGLELCDGCIYEAPPDPPPH